MNNESEISSSETSEKRDTVSHNERLNDILEIKLGRQEVRKFQILLCEELKFTSLVGSILLL